MKEYFLIVLFFEKESYYNPLLMAEKMKNLYEELKDPIILPINQTNINYNDLPIIAFEQNPRIKLQANYKKIIYIHIKSRCDSLPFTM